MFSTKATILCLRGPRSGGLTSGIKECLKSYSSKARLSSGFQRWRTPILATVGGGMALGVGLVTSLWYDHLHEESPLGIQEAGCKEKAKWKDKDTFGDAVWRQEIFGKAGLKEAMKRSRDLLQRAKDEVGSPGIVAAVSINGRLVWAEGIGYADVENRLPCSSDGVHRIASISKSLTMTAVAKLWEEGKLDLDQPIRHYVPEFPEKEVDGKKVDITTRQLVSHLGGIRHYNKDYIKKLGNQSNKEGISKLTKDSKIFSKSDKSKDTPKNTEEKGENDTKETEFYITKDYSSVIDALDVFKEDPLVHKPGSKFLYTTHGWTLVSAIVDAAADEDFLVYMKKIFKDLGMSHTVPDEASKLIYNRARGYTKNKKGKLINVPAVNLSHKWAGGGFLSDVKDLIQFGNAMLYSYQYTDEHRDAGLPQGYLQPETMKTIWSPVPLTKCSWDAEGVYTMGWAVRERGKQQRGLCPEKHQMVSHTGGAIGASSVLLIVDCSRPEIVSKGQPVKNNSIQDDILKRSSLGNSPTQNDNSMKHDIASSRDLSLPKGIAVAIIVNLDDIGLFKTAVDIAEEFQKVNHIF
ncbi:serine beta-lactamase-like protein LACTB, mitochondrial isoform X2 [Acanthaster planci]|uniref:Serine beta-lactamase-like protein LACTB, mitochondrial isoform X2 n=1 Tax=Acanthaster planci TaxID=133434 RepID=A0A8B7XWW5_ACAPL|nr:serine beta-lactamase-like protein LACTB, mitochondrial isoform X2 [Acanthaster planci]XP_022085360.1 serine beta-lactamase-like protein LACTB, mitochondrial isoform X2 [Acanthaster planci]XP_022085368.1 serine beta-lactamase-like protein LACTB, mitochondrial isoform X2 [Acanthaster planci]